MIIVDCDVVRTEVFALFLVLKSCHRYNVGLCGACKADITMPSGRHEKPRVIDNKNGTMDVAFRPSEVGQHQLDVSYDGSPIEGSPFQFYVDEPQPGRVTAYGPGLSHGFVDTDCDFTIVTKDAGIGGKNVMKLLQRQLKLPLERQAFISDSCKIV